MSVEKVNGVVLAVAGGVVSDSPPVAEEVEDEGGPDDSILLPRLKKILRCFKIWMAW